MRLFQAQPCGEGNSPPPPPHFSVEREATRIMPVYLNQYRDGRRVPTPEKVAVMELSNSFERRRLGKHQQILNDISQRCREQEVSDLSNNMSVKVNLRKFDRQDREMTFYSTNFMNPRLKRENANVALKLPGEQQQRNGFDLEQPGNTSPRPGFEKAYKHFPVRRIMRHNTKFDFFKPAPSLPKLENVLPKSSSSDTELLKSRMFQRGHVNGTIQMEHYLSPRPELAPLILPQLENFYPGTQSERLERTDTCFSTRGMVLGERSRTQLTFGGGSRLNGLTLTQNGGKTIPFDQELSKLHLTSGNSPPPNSVQENDAVMT